MPSLAMNYCIFFPATATLLNPSDSPRGLRFGLVRFLLPVGYWPDSSICSSNDLIGWRYTGIFPSRFQLRIVFGETPRNPAAALTVKTRLG